MKVVIVGSRNLHVEISKNIYLKTQQKLLAEVLVVLIPMHEHMPK